MKIKYYLILIFYYLLVVLPHQQVGGVIASIFVPSSGKKSEVIMARERYDDIMLVVLCLLLIIVAIWAWRNVRTIDKALIAIYAVLTSIFIAICVSVLFVLNVEAIHFIQYALFAIICFQVINSYWKTMYWAVLAGAIDELYQYVYLAPERSEYYDFNDVIINAVGAGIGLLLAMHFTKSALLKSYEMVMTLGVIIMLIIGFITGIISYGPDPEALFCFMKTENINFWYTVKTGPKVLFYVVKPIEGIFIVAGLIAFYGFLESGSHSQG